MKTAITDYFQNVIGEKYSIYFEQQDIDCLLDIIQQPSPTVTDEEIERMAKEEHKFNHKSVNEILFRLGFFEGFKVAQSRLSQPVTGYSEEGKTILGFEIIPVNSSSVLMTKGKGFLLLHPDDYNTYIQSIKSKPNNGSNEGATRYGDAVEFHRWMKENEDTQENINLSEWELYTKFKEGRI